MTAQQKYLNACGGFRDAVHVAMSLSRAVWTLCAEPLGEQKAKDVYREVRLEDLRQAFEDALGPPALRPVFRTLIDLLCERNIGWLPKGDLDITLRRSIVNPLDLLRTILAGTRPDHEVRYFAMRNIRHYYDCVQSAETAHDLHALASAVNTMIGRHPSAHVSPSGTTWHVRDLRACLSSVVVRHPSIRHNISKLFVECCRIVNYMLLSDNLGHIDIRTSRIDAEYLLSRLFGLPTAIPGLDDLFGGGGIMLVEDGKNETSERIGGRAVLSIGPFGTGKSLLSLQMAVEVARKGGVAWVMPLEQTTEECLYALQSTGRLPDGGPLRVATTVETALEYLEQPDGERGALILLRSIKQSFSDFVSSFDEHVRLMRRYPLRLIVVDPVSALSQSDEPDVAARRSAMLRMFETVKQQGTNIWLVAEEALPGENSRYEQNIADTVIQVSNESRHGYSQRYIEITKSRLQREQRGRHAFAIGPGRGITVYPSTAAVKSRIKQRTMRAPDLAIKSGLPSLDAILGEKGLYAGDVVVLQGPSGCSKTEVGISFLLEPDWLSDRRSRKQHQRALLVSARDHEATLRHVLGRMQALRRRREAGGPRRPPADVRVLIIEGGYVKPGYILQRIEDEFHDAQLARCPIGRVMVDSIPHWDLTCPYIHEDNTFGDTLIDLLRRHRVTTLLTCGQSSRQPESVLHRTVLDSADCLVHFELVEFKGMPRIMVRVAHTRDMMHRREFFELRSDAQTLELHTASTLLRVEPDGRVTPVKVRLFLHAESPSHAAYNDTLLAMVRSVLSRDADIQSDNPAHVRGALGLASSSAIDELQVVQLDEFRVPTSLVRTDSVWHVFDGATWNSPGWADTLPRLRDRVERNNALLAIPYYVNVGLMAHRRGIDPRLLESWETLARLCSEWEADHSAGEVFFDLPQTGENYNCLFFEILHSIAGPPVAGGPGPRPSICALERWITSDLAVHALLILHRLCKRTHAAALSQKAAGAAFAAANPRAQVWRHWYTTVNEMLAAMSPEERTEIVVGQLPQGVAVAGDCFLALPEYSAAADVGMHLIQRLTDQEAELDRLRWGVGLPTRASFYPDAGFPVSISPYFTMSPDLLKNVVGHAFRRSTFGCYEAVGQVLSAHIQGIASIASTHEDDIVDEIRRTIAQLRLRLGFLGQNSCLQCRAPGRRAKSSARTEPAA